jgi:hypothetical protein
MRCRFPVAAGAFMLAAACSTEPTSPAAAIPSHDLRSQAIQLTVDLTTGTMQTGRPKPAGGASHALIGDEGIVIAGINNMVCAPIARTSPQQKRCTFGMDLLNAFQSTDLITPKTFPRPPQGTNGVLIFPFAASSDGSGGWAEPSPDWNLGPINMFNDFGNCSGAAKTDCYRYKLVASPFRALAFAYDLPVGFDVPADANKITAYIVVAADLRENAQQTLLLVQENDLCGRVDADGSIHLPPEGFVSLTSVSSGFCSFQNPLRSPDPVEILKAELTFAPYTYFLASTLGTNFLVEHIDYGPTLDASDFWIPPAPATSTFEAMCCSAEGDRWRVDVAPSVQRAADQKLRYLQYRMTLKPGSTAIPVIDNTQSRATLRITYRLR